jgi:hypothetical protein
MLSSSVSLSPGSLHTPWMVDSCVITVFKSSVDTWESFWHTHLTWTSGWSKTHWPVCQTVGTLHPSCASYPCVGIPTGTVQPRWSWWTWTGYSGLSSTHCTDFSAEPTVPNPLWSTQCLNNRHGLRGLGMCIRGQRPIKVVNQTTGPDLWTGFRFLTNLQSAIGVVLCSRPGWRQFFFNFFFQKQIFNNFFLRFNIRSCSVFDTRPMSWGAQSRQEWRWRSLWCSKPLKDTDTFLPLGACHFLVSRKD